MIDTFGKILFIMIIIYLFYKSHLWIFIFYPFIKYNKKNNEYYLFNKKFILK
jgi:hypothetical protein